VIAGNHENLLVAYLQKGRDRLEEQADVLERSLPSQTAAAIDEVARDQHVFGPQILRFRQTALKVVEELPRPRSGEILPELTRALAARLGRCTLLVKMQVGQMQEAD
jgi:hypothetical protein